MARFINIFDIIKYCCIYLIVTAAVCTSLLLVKNSKMLVAATPAPLPSSSRLLSKLAWSVLRQAQAPAPSTAPRNKSRRHQGGV